MSAKLGRPPEWSRETALDALRDYVAEYGEVPSAHEADRAFFMPTTMTYRRLFGSWSAAVNAAGFKTRPAGRPWMAETR